MEKTPALHFYCHFYRHQSSGTDQNVAVFLYCSTFFSQKKLKVDLVNVGFLFLKSM